MVDSSKADELGSPAAARARVLLCVVDDSEELHVALEFAGLRARRTGAHVALLYVVERPADFQHWAAVGDLMREEAREQAEQVLQRAGGEVQRWAGTYPIFYLREGGVGDEVVSLVAEEPEISILILGADTGPQGPGPLVSSLTGKSMGQLRVPLVVVPGNLSDDELEALA